MPMPQRFENGQLEQVIDQGLIYQCACPAQVARLLLALRDVREYQLSCLALKDTALQASHMRILESVEAAHAVLEQCFDDVLDLEKWDKTHLTMPADLCKMAREELNRWLDKPA